VYMWEKELEVPSLFKFKFFQKNSSLSFFLFLCLFVFCMWCFIVFVYLFRFCIYSCLNFLKFTYVLYTNHFKLFFCLCRVTFHTLCYFFHNYILYIASSFSMMKRGEKMSYFFIVNACNFLNLISKAHIICQNIHLFWFLHPIV
jgi:hypothetical protein